MRLAQVRAERHCRHVHPTTNVRCPSLSFPLPLSPPLVRGSIFRGHTPHTVVVRALDLQSDDLPIGAPNVAYAIGDLTVLTVAKRRVCGEQVRAVYSGWIPWSEMIFFAPIVMARKTHRYDRRRPCYLTRTVLRSQV